MTDPLPAATKREKVALPLQEPFLSQVRDRQVGVTVYLVNGIKLQGTILAFDNHTILLSGGATKQLVFKHAVSTIVPAHAVSVREGDVSSAA